MGGPNQRVIDFLTTCGAKKVAADLLAVTFAQRIKSTRS
jgi:hypothetical protein